MQTPPKTSQPRSSSVKVNSLDSQKNCSHIIYGKNCQYYAEWAGHLSLKSFSDGQAFYDAGVGHYAVDDDSYLILNEMQPYSITIDSEIKVESFCIFFETGFAEEVGRSLTAKTIHLLDAPEKLPTEHINFVQRLYPYEHLSAVLSELKSSIGEKKDDEFWLKEKLHKIMRGILRAREDTFKEIERLPFMRASTREELYKRIYRARDFAAASYHRNVTLDEMAKVACLSPDHFLRTFKAVFRQTPHQYLTALRLKQAKKLLARTDLSITDVCLSVGFESHGSFSSLFRRRVGISPETYRRQKSRF